MHPETRSNINPFAAPPDAADLRPRVHRIKLPQPRICDRLPAFSSLVPAVAVAAARHADARRRGRKQRVCIAGIFEGLSETAGRLAEL